MAHELYAAQRGTADGETKRVARVIRKVEAAIAARKTQRKE